MNHDQTKHIDINRFYIKEKLEEKVLSIEYVPSMEQCNDLNQVIFSQTILLLNLRAKNDKYPFPHLRGSVEE